MSKVGTTIVLSEEDMHRLILTAGKVAYDRCRAGQDWPKTRMEIIDALVGATRSLTDEEAEHHGFKQNLQT